MVLMIWDLVFSDHGYFVFKQEYIEQQQLESDIHDLKNTKGKLGQDVIRLREDPKTLEEVIHRELGYVYPDETMIIMPETKTEMGKEESER